MGKTIAASTRFDRMRDVIEDKLFPTTCRVYQPVETETDYGDTVRTEVAVAYGLIYDIPCRIDNTRYYRQAEVFGQEAVVSDFEIHVPWDAPLHQDWEVELDGLRYQIRKLFDAETWRSTKSALVSRVGQGSST